ncbi:maleylpyruvate isomerase family mycothiol-dependent enzyme [Cumulibacter manganitolerans]|uniref:maleylpyruvate isomerase family mycothiol-dependent enzyme n=1 Tax=Cumulibacter manganitolerans TaxID=1884992 RepID=UPI0012966475|nr:maleylpyruvate isomerase family mycothiol-dependent enzyme [Cumulibacter manganitolerans]
MTTLTPAALVRGSLDGQREAMRLVAALRDEQYGEPSRLPGWTRAHVVAHLVGNALAQTRQVEYALRGMQIEVYTGGQQARDSDIERRSGLPPAELATLLRDAHAGWERAVAHVDADLAAAPVAYRDGTVADVVAGRWMESLVHAVDLGLPTYTCLDWGADFSELLIGYVRVRLPTDQSVRLEATDTPYTATFGGPGPEVRLRGRLGALAGLLADRGTPGAVASLAAPLAELGPYPRGSVRR